MKAIVIKESGKVVYCENVAELTIHDYSKFKAESEKYWIEKGKEHEKHEREKLELIEKVKSLEEKIKDLYHQIAIDRGEE